MMKNIMRYIPGFRSNEKGKMLVASTYYIICLAVFFSSGIEAALFFLFTPIILFGLIKLLIKTSTDPRFKEALISESNKQTERKNELKVYEQELKDKRIAYCPKCLSTSLSAQKKGYGVGKAVIADKILHSASDSIFIGGIGRNKMFVYCLNCGHKFKPRR